ncbi:hypothetical protein [Treponema sp.]|uniref:hypothetical protein n=1 Tax=Treponema sp. TaxID=166 RepID=UPI003FA1E9F8
MEYDKKNNRGKIKEAMRNYQFDRNGKKYNSIIRWHNISPEDSFFNRGKDKIISNAGAE